METQPNSVQLIFERHLSPTFDELLHYVDVAYVACFETFTIVENKPLVLWRVKLGVDVRLASCET